MILTVGELKKYLQDVPDDTIFGAMMPGESKLVTWAPKRLLLLESGKMGYNGKMCVINNMGTHWNEKWSKNNHCTPIGYIDDRDYKLNIFKKTSQNQTK